MWVASVGSVSHELIATVGVHRLTSVRAADRKSSVDATVHRRGETAKTSCLMGDTRIATKWPHI